MVAFAARLVKGDLVNLKIFRLLADASPCSGKF
jgi:hypothetical protein